MVCNRGSTGLSVLVLAHPEKRRAADPSCRRRRSGRSRFYLWEWSNSVLLGFCGMPSPAPIGQRLQFFPTLWWDPPIHYQPFERCPNIIQCYSYPPSLQSPRHFSTLSHASPNTSFRMQGGSGEEQAGQPTEPSPRLGNLGRPRCWANQKSRPEAKNVTVSPTSLLRTFPQE